MSLHSFSTGLTHGLPPQQSSVEIGGFELHFLTFARDSIVTSYALRLGALERCWRSSLKRSLVRLARFELS